MRHREMRDLGVGGEAPAQAALAALFAVGVLAGAGLGWIGAAASATPAPAAPPATVAPLPTDPSPRASTPQETTGPHSPATPSAEECPDFETLCNYRMLTAGCVPSPVPDALQGVYDPDSVRAWVEELASSCDTFRASYLGLDCREYPCMLLMRPEPELPAEETPDGGLVVMSDWSAGVTCGATGGPALGTPLPNVNGEHRVDFVPVMPSYGFAEHAMRLVNRNRFYEPADLEDLVRGQAR